ncbi:uncharacterized protein LOC133285879 [Gastrolobium bilobum]|uniref:uncharacterized protein LOC133285879 n=1 Tax=Gastrolobium bilobum TaxID=150636 RepID=UPI002AB1486E|nr:uncharacterized protein LOC133285879 [Gastrolobium bilobum]XP_061339165.1 uncharacterized protein LOC133285879 [Gastrolobium bilobum]XP_061339166.1 uncharacterized protein LOC133285879 [Gastrolobium bilobum]
MSVESAPKPRLVRCPKCWQLLPESPDYDVYKCGGCGTTLQAKKRKNKAVNSESSTRETDAAPRNALDHVSKESGLKEKAAGSSSGECSLDGNDGRGQIESSECNGQALVISQESDLRAKATSSSSGECSLNGNGGRSQIENDECNGEQLVISKENGLRAKATSSSSGEFSLNGNGGRGQIENGECNEEQLVISQENDLSEKAICSSSVEYSLNGIGGRSQIENGECNEEQLGPFNLSDEELENEMDIYKLSDIRKRTVSNQGCSNELTHSEIEASAELMAENSVENANDTNLQLEGEEPSNGNMLSEGAGEQLISAFNTEDANDEKSAPEGVKSEVDNTGSDLEIPEELNNGNLLLEGAEKELIPGSDGQDLNNGKSVLEGANPEMDITGSNKAASEELDNGNLILEGEEEELNMCASDGEDPNKDQSAQVDAKSEVDIPASASAARKLSTENFVRGKGSKLEEGTSGNHVSSPKILHRSFDSVRSVDTFDNIEVINPNSEIGGTLGELSESPTTRSSHAYDGSISSNGGVDERFPSQNLDSFENTYTVANGVSDGVSGRGKGLVHSMLYGDHETQQHVLKDSRGNQNEVPETARHGYARWMKAKKDEFPSQKPLHRSGYQSGYESGSPSNQTHDELYCSSSFLSPDSFEDPDQEKMKLLRMVYKLQDQLNRTGYVNGETNGRLSTGKHVSAYQSHDLHEGRFYHGLDYPRCDGRCSHGINWRQRHKYSQIPYSAEATSSTYHVDHSCFHCYPQEWQCSAELPPHVLYQHEEFCRPHLGCNCCSSQHSYPSSPQWFMTSKLLTHGRETKSSDQRHSAPGVKKYFREKTSLTKRHYRPVAGGAPFVTCHKCSKLLQIPADFLLFKRVCHQLKCGSCQEVLKFSLQNGSHIVSFAPNALGTPSSDIDDQNEVINGSNLNSGSHANYYHSSHADPISYSDDYDHSVSKSYSSEGDPVYVTPSNSMHASEYGNPSVSHGTFEPITEKEKIASRGPSASKAPVATEELAVPVHSSNMSSEMDARLPPKSSPLHQLMGYSSPSQVIRGTPSSVEGKEPILNGENDPSHNSQQS